VSGPSLERQLSRRTFLAAGVGLTLASACGSDDDGSTATATSTRPSTTLRPVNQPTGLDVVVAAPQLVAGVDQRLTIGVFRNGEPLPDGEPVRVAFGREYGETSAPAPAEFHNQGIESRPYYLSQFRFDAPGTWVLEATAGGRTGGAALKVVPPGEVEVPLPGERLVPVVTPTTQDARGVNPICTRKPACQLHDISVASALDEGMPLAVLFSTPALCTSRVCGPVLDVLVNELPSASEVHGIHVEVWNSLDTGFKADDLTEGMRSYHLTFEPVLFLAGADGVIRERLDGPFDRLEARAALARLTS
jgi:hypothetical protein